MVTAVTLGNEHPVAAQDATPKLQTPAPTNTRLIETVAGKNAAQYAAELSSENRTIRLRAIKSLLAFGEPAREHLASVLAHEDPAIRYIACVGLGDLAGRMKRESTDVIPSLEKLATDDPSAAVQMAAGYALCQAGNVKRGLPILIDRLEAPERGVVCSAAELIGKIGPEASAATETLQRISR